MNQKRLTLQNVVDKLYNNPRKIFNLPEQPDTYIEIDLDEEWTIPNEMPFSKSKWTPFAGMSVKGKVRRVVLRGEVAYIDNKVLVQEGFGQNVLTWNETIQSAKPTPVTVKKEEIVSPLSVTNLVGEGDLSVKVPKSGNLKKMATDMYCQMLQELGVSDSKAVHQEASKPLSISVSSPPLIRRTVSSPVPYNIGLYGKHIISVQMFNHTQLHELFNLAHKFRICVLKEKPLDRYNDPIQLDQILKGKVMASIFYEVSTRTSCSFSAAMVRIQKDFSLLFTKIHIFAATTWRSSDSHE